MATKENLIGKTFNYLTVINKRKDPEGKGKIWQCVCECGTYIFLTTQKITQGQNKSCGCKRLELISKALTTHGGKGTPEFNIWCAMIARCYRKTSVQYKYYGARGIKVCDRWLNSFENFLEDMGKRPSTSHSLDRYPNNKNGHYTKSNCRWATPIEQARNRRNNVLIKYKGETKCMSEWAQILGIDLGSIYWRRLKKWSWDKILSTPTIKK